MSWIRGYYRLCLAGLTLGCGGTMIVLTSWIPAEIKGFRVSFWILMLVVRTLNAIFNVKVTCSDRAAFRRHEGFIFPNHVSYLDPLVLASVTPVRFLAKQEIRSWPLIGLIARAIGCAFVKREDKKSRAEARTTLAKLETYPPIALFPEGTKGPGDALLPFRYGAFDIAVRADASFLPCTIEYDPLETAIWRRKEHILIAIWRLATYNGSVQAALTALAPVKPAVDADPAELALATQSAMAEAMNLPIKSSK